MKFAISFLNILVYSIFSAYAKEAVHLRKEISPSPKNNSLNVNSEIREIVSIYKSMKNELNDLTTELNSMRDSTQSMIIEQSKNSLQDKNNKKTIHKLLEKEKVFSSTVDESVRNLNEFSNNIEVKIKIMEKTANKNGKSKKKTKQYDNSLLFYNSLSLIMLCLLTGGLVGVVFILYYSFKSPEKPTMSF